MIRQPTTTYTDRFQKAIKFYDFTYHLHKSTFKGLSSFYKMYSDAQKNYADSLLSISKSAWSEIPQLSRQNPSLVAVVKQIISCMQTTSQLHFNYAERLTEVSAYYNSEYLSSKKKKDNQMKMLKDKNQQDYNALRERQKNRNVINAKEKDICKNLYDNFDKLAEEENDRIHKVKEQTIIYFSLYKKVCQKQLEWTSEYNLKLVKQQFQVKNPKIGQMAEQLRLQYNQYGGDQMQRKSYDINKSMMFNRDSLRASMALKQRNSRLQQTQNKLKNIVSSYDAASDNLILVTSNEVHPGLFDDRKFTKEQKRKYSRQLNSQVIKNIVYDMIQGHCKSQSLPADQLSLLQLIKASLRVKSQVTPPNFQCPQLLDYLSQARSQITDKQYIFNLGMLQQISKSSQGNSSNLDRLIVKKLRNELNASDISSESNFDFAVKICIIDTLVDTVCVTRPNQPILIQGYIEYLVLIAKFGEMFLGIARTTTILILLKKLDRMLAHKNTNEEIEHIFMDNYFLSGQYQMSESRIKLANQIQDNAKSAWSAEIVNNCTSNLINFFKIKSSFLNYLKILLVIERLRLSPVNNFNARDHFYMSIRCAGYNYMKSSQQCSKMLIPDAILPEKRLKYVVEGIEDLDYEGVSLQYLNPASVQTSKLLGVGQKIVRNKLFDEFTAPANELIEGNLSLLSEQDGVDRDGYILRLGIIFAKLDIQNPQPISIYDTFFKVLKSYLQSTEKDYDHMLQHSRQTELWIMQQNALATSNCIDFCSLLYKPFQFLLISLKQLQKSRKTDYTKKYSEYIKLRLNTVLKDQIIKYINFLYESLANYRFQASEIVLKPKRVMQPHQLKKQQMEKERLGFKQLTRRLFNLLFLKDQLQEMVCDFLDPEVYKKLDNSIFKVDKLNKMASQSPQYRDLLNNIKEIVQAVLANEQRIVKRVSNISIFYCMSKIFDNLYFQEEKNAIQQFFSNAADYKLSQHTFLKYQQTLQDWFVLIARNIPDQFTKRFQHEFCRSFFQAIEFEVLNSTKFKLPFKTQSVIQYLDSDVAFITTLMKQKFFEDATISQCIKVPFKQLLGDLQADTPRLIYIFETATLKNDRTTCKYALAILNLRVKDEKAIQFVKKYKSIAQN